MLWWLLCWQLLVQLPVQLLMQLPVQLLQHEARYLWPELTLNGLQRVGLVCVCAPETKQLTQQLLDSCSALTAMPEYIHRIPYVLTWTLAQSWISSFISSTCSILKS